ncbi:uncharacterized protein ATC70_002529 [Mucor velutinosus]|uniref:Choice-of-anchor A domain-containing protein n=1 Tax=Mucor velutinosus TaxID=708070 RepID=A0AAN7DCH4_9FUNG|nr:hypothetical protein ATC70_002529 [Mucor velutinosus]
MKHGSITAIICCVLMHSGLSNAADTPQLRSPQCVTDLTRIQVNMMHHFNGIFGDFITKNSNEATEASMYGPIAAFNITSNGYNYNSKAKMDCGSSNTMLRLGLMSKHADIQGDVNSDVWTESGSIDTRGTKNCVFAALPRVQHPNEDLVQSLFSFAPTTIKKTSAKLSTLAPDTAITSVANGLVSPSRARSFVGYRILKLPACSDRGCAATSKVETQPSVLRGSNTWMGQYKNGVLPDEMIVFNVPVYVGGTFTISTLDVNKGISPCQAIFNFYAVDQAGMPVSDPNAFFTLIRSPGVTIAGTILAPQARIIDTSTGYFGGQLITLQSYEGHGADIKDFDSVSHEQCTSRSLCWPMVKAPRVVTAVVTATARETFVSTIKTDRAATAATMAENRAAVVLTPAPVVVTKTVTMSLPSNSRQTNVYEPVEFYADENEEEGEKEEEEDKPIDCGKEEQEIEIETKREMKIIHETPMHRHAITHYSENVYTTTVMTEELQVGVALDFVTILEPITFTSSSTDDIQIESISYMAIETLGLPSVMAYGCQDEEEREEDNEEHHHHKYHKHHKRNKHWSNKDQGGT